jgi:uracil-DNA glycosylase
VIAKPTSQKKKWSRTSIRVKKLSIADDLFFGVGSHCLEWGGCTKCELAVNATNHVLFRGSFPADVLFIGEAPGNSEDITGVPFIGSSGKLLDQIIKATEWSFSCLIINTVACIPLDTENNLTKPTKEQIAICSPRVLDCYNMANPKAVVFVGRTAEGLKKHLPLEEDGIPCHTMYHPAYLLRKGGIWEGGGEDRTWIPVPVNLEYKRTVLRLQQFLTITFKEYQDEEYED